ncbi:MAG: signal peptidase I [Eubacteriales bacterium]|nr:signal peptidase I [Eubacteriales bacterium]
MEQKNEEKNEEKKKSIMSEVLDYVKMIAIVLAVVLIVDGVVLINARIPSGSMEKTIMTGDRIFGLRLAYGLNIDLLGFEYSTKWKDPERYDIVIFHYPDDESQLYIKRIIGLPGETVEIRQGKVYINGSEKPLEDSFINGEPVGDFGPYEVPEDSYFMLGDNRQNSKDSRYWNNKFVRFDQIVGKALFRYFPTPKLLNNK